MKEFNTIISACLLGIPCRYNGKSKIDKKALDVFLNGRSILVCPEISIGQNTPRPACEIAAGDGVDVLAGKARVVDKDGNDYTSEFIGGADVIVNEIVKKHEIKKAFLKSGSPSCGVNCIYSGKFNGEKIEGCGVLTATLRAHGIEYIKELG